MNDFNLMSVPLPSPLRDCQINGCLNPVKQGMATCSADRSDLCWPTDDDEVLFGGEG